MKQKVKRDTYLVVYTVYKIHPSKLRSHGTCIWKPIFSCSWRWLAKLVRLVTPRTILDVDSNLFPRAEYVDDSLWPTTKDGKLVLTNE